MAAQWVKRVMEDPEEEVVVTAGDRVMIDSQDQKVQEGTLDR